MQVKSHRISTFPFNVGAYPSALLVFGFGSINSWSVLVVAHSVGFTALGKVATARADFPPES